MMKIDRLVFNNNEILYIMLDSSIYVYIWYIDHMFLKLYLGGLLLDLKI